MKSFMRQRGNSWELRVFLGRDPVTGKKRYAQRTVRGGKREAQRALAEMVTDAERGLTASTTATVGELLEAWFEFAAPDFSPKTVRETRGYIDRSLLPVLGSKSLAKLKPAQLDAFYRRLIESGGSGGKPLAPGTVRRIHGILRRATQESPDLACYLMLAAATGARRSELVALRWPDIDLETATVSIERGIVQGPDGLVEKGTKTHSARRVSLDARTAC